jgi:hypothetical protein
MLSRDAFYHASLGVRSLGTFRHAQMLYGLIRWLRPQSVVEVGTCFGAAAVWMARALQENHCEIIGGDAEPTPLGSITCIDDWSLTGSAVEFLVNVGRCDVADVLRMSAGRSTDLAMWPERVDFAFIDGDHSYEGCRRDVLEAVGRGATCIAFHDAADWWGPVRFLLEAECVPLWDGWDLIAQPHDGGLAVLLKRPEWPAVTMTEADFPTGAVQGVRDL